MLIINLGMHERIFINGAEIKLINFGPTRNCVKIGVEAPRHITVLRAELLGRTHIQYKPKRKAYDPRNRTGHGTDRKPA